MANHADSIPLSTQEHIFAQWTAVQAELAAFTSPQIGFVSHFSAATGPGIGAFATASLDGLPAAGPFDSAWDYFVAVAEGLVAQALQRQNSSRFATLGALTSSGPFPFSHMDMGMQNVLVDDALNFVAVIDWEETAEILQDPGHIAHRNVARRRSPRGCCSRGHHVEDYKLAGKIDVFCGLEEELTYEMVRLDLPARRRSGMCRYWQRRCIAWLPS
ncbi:hypothetical protein B0T26DRAFT_675373 [Lasiosphaeria miniovina]|uniref:Aminoglycoside phosphotransferase domain-containing protein n=1 Tax=Lasiosphaeria miniovina TaxID=1954250 RepID=A0AA40AJJ0_9PEZI|nr:uncharacterized protein B0T26DRAFT_675373 [Lasiosphaeria miniovina]KAK0716984.1 hypothetical protein B0T26DRAFT_675373 [Lasiosphaeria miniovina]